MHTVIVKMKRAQVAIKPSVALMQELGLSSRTPEVVCWTWLSEKDTEALFTFMPLERLRDLSLNWIVPASVPPLFYRRVFYHVSN